MTITNERPKTPFGIAGETKRSGATECLLTTLAESTVERIKFTYGLKSHDGEDLVQSIYLHVLSNWQYWSPEDCPVGAALRMFVIQGASRAVKTFRDGSGVVVLSDVDTSSDDGYSATVFAVDEARETVTDWSAAENAAAGVTMRTSGTPTEGIGTQSEFDF